MLNFGEVELPIQKLFNRIVERHSTRPGSLLDWDPGFLILLTTMPRAGSNQLSESTEVQQIALDKLVGDALLEGLKLLLSARQSALPASVILLNWGTPGWSDAWPSNAGVSSNGGLHSWLLSQVEATVVLTDLAGDIGVLLVPRKVVELIEQAASQASGSLIDHPGASQTPQG